MGSTDRVEDGRVRLGPTLIGARQLARRVAELGAQISVDYAGRPLLVIGVLKGALVFLADLVRALELPVELDFMAIASYGSGTDSSGVVRILKDLERPIAGRDVLVVEDIVSSGLTLRYLLRNLSAREPASLAVCALLAKPTGRKLPAELRYIGFEIPERFVVGYGLDHGERWRNLPYIAALEVDGEGVEGRGSLHKR